MNTRPFENCGTVDVVLPTDLSDLEKSDIEQVKSIKRLLEEHRGAIERELGAEFRFGENSKNSSSPKWIIGPFRCNPKISEMGLKEPSGPQIVLDRQNRVLVTHGRTPTEVTETYSYLRSLYAFEGGTWTIEECKSTDEAVDRIVREVKNSYPAFDLKNIKWDKVCETHIKRVKSASDPIPAMQRWLAELTDAHTWVRPFPPFAELPYDLYVREGEGVFYNIPKNSNAWKLGVRPGHKLLDQNYDDWWGRTSASDHSKPWIVGKRVLSSKVGSVHHLKARIHDEKIVEWEEEPLADRWNPAVIHKRLLNSVGYIKVLAWMLGKNIEESIDEAFDSFKNCSGLIVDLRSSPGGDLLMAHRFRNRFLKKDGPLGWIQNTLPDGSLSSKEHIMGEVAEADKRWTKPVVFLTDPLTYSASEDVILGLQGQPHVKVVGKPSGGGSGRMRIIRLLPDYRLTVSTSLTYDLAGNCIEGRGIPIDVEVPLHIGENESDKTLIKAKSLF